METNNKKQCKSCGRMVSQLYQFDFCRDCIIRKFAIIKKKLYRSRVSK